MARGKGSELLAAAFDEKPYKKALQEVVRWTVVRPVDFDTKAIALLDVLEERGRAQEACEFLKTTLAEKGRPSVSNWKGYIYTLLRSFDEAAYAAMKEGKGETVRRRKSDRTAAKEAKAAAKLDASKAAAAVATIPQGAMTPGPAVLLSPKSSPKSPATVVALSEAIAFGPVPAFPKPVYVDRTPPPPPPIPGAAFKKTAEEFVPGKLWTGGSLRPDAAAFVPSAIWTTPSFSTTPPEFVQPGLWPTAVKQSRRVAKQLKQEAPEFVPGQPTWAGTVAGEGKTPKAKVKATKATTTPAQPGPIPPKQKDAARASPKAAPRAAAAQIETSVPNVEVAPPPPPAPPAPSAPPAPPATPAPQVELAIPGDDETVDPAPEPQSSPRRAPSGSSMKCIAPPFMEPIDEPLEEHIDAPDHAWPRVPLMSICVVLGAIATAVVMMRRARR